jgi:hypothetical protein
MDGVSFLIKILASVKIIKEEIVKKNIFNLLIIINIIFMNILIVDVVHSTTMKEQKVYNNDKLEKELLTSAEKIFEQENNAIERIDEIRYEGIETELENIYPILFKDVIYLLNWVLECNPNNIDANYLLGKIYYLQRELDYEYNKNAIGLANKYISKVIELSKTKYKDYDKAKLSEAKKMLTEITQIKNDINDAKGK